jgi:hypothetical protein
MAEPIEALTAFLVVTHTTGQVDVHTSAFPMVNVQRQADLVDIETAVDRIGHEVNRQLIKQALMPESPKTPADLVAEALAKRAED